MMVVEEENEIRLMINRLMSYLEMKRLNIELRRIEDQEVSEGKREDKK